MTDSRARKPTVRHNRRHAAQGQQPPTKDHFRSLCADGNLTTDFFGFDNTADTYGLEGKGDLSEMGDAVLGMVCKELGTAAPNYAIVRNVSDPQIDSTGLTLEQQTDLAGTIYKGYGLWSSICSAIVRWAIVAAL